MLTPEYLEAMPEPVLTLYREAELAILRNMAERIAKYDYWIPTADWQNMKLKEAGITQEEILRILSQYTGKTEEALRELMQQATTEGLRSDVAVYEAAGEAVPPISESEPLVQTLNAGFRATRQTMRNLTRTTANTATQQFERALDAAWMQVRSGAMSYDQAIRNAVKGLAQSGVESIRYPSGRVDTLEVATRRAVVTGVNQTTLQLQEQLADEMKFDLVEVSAHAGARPSHAEWQGEIYSRSGTSKKYPSLVEKTGYGTGAGLGGWNCRHSFSPWFEGSPRTYSKELLDSYNERSISYDGKMLTEYEASQVQRSIERNIRKWKREFEALDAAGLDTSEAAARLKIWQDRMKDFTKQTGLKQQSAREQIAGFGRSAAGKATQQEISRRKMVSDFSTRMEKAGFTTSGFDYYFGDRETLEHMASSFERMGALYPKEAKGTVVRWGYDKDPDTFGLYYPMDGSIKFNRQAMGNWAETVASYDKRVAGNYFPQGTNADSIFIHEFGHRVWYARGGGSANKAVKKVFEDMGYGKLSRGHRDTLMKTVLSEYAAEETKPSYQEAIAESFSEYYNSSTPRAFCRRLLKEVGLI